jgi:hypothetical protein
MPFRGKIKKNCFSLIASVGSNAFKALNSTLFPIEALLWYGEVEGSVQP